LSALGHGADSLARVWWRIRTESGSSRSAGVERLEC
jgi:hypothetical protein